MDNMKICPECQSDNIYDLETDYNEFCKTAQIYNGCMDCGHEWETTQYIRGTIIKNI